TAELMLREGATVVATDVDEARGSALASRLAQSCPGRIEFVRLDVTREAEWEAAFAHATARHGPPAILVNNAGVAPQLLPLAQTSLEEWRRVIAVNLDGVFLGVKHAIRAMTGRGGAIVNVSSVAGLVGAPLNGAYSPAKAGVLLLTKSAAPERASLDPPIRAHAARPAPHDRMDLRHPGGGAFRETNPAHRPPATDGGAQRHRRSDRLSRERPVTLHDRFEPGGRRRLDGAVGYGRPRGVALPGRDPR